MEANSGLQLTLDDLKLRGKFGIAAALTEIEKAPYADQTTKLLDSAYANPRGKVVGITGPPGAGKSTLINALISLWRQKAYTVAVVAIDPSSQISGGALLGDRVRLRLNPQDEGVFVRSVAARRKLGGVADIAFPATVLLRAVFDYVIVETVGVGQSETGIANIAETIVLCIQPGSGDSLQFMKAGIAEIPHIAVVTKADMGAVATRALADVKGALSLAHRVVNAFEPLTLAISAVNAIGISDLTRAVSQHQAWLSEGNRLPQTRSTHAKAWFHDEVLTHFGRRGLELIPRSVSTTVSERPFQLAGEILSQLTVVYHAS